MPWRLRKRMLGGKVRWMIGSIRQVGCEKPLKSGGRVTVRRRSDGCNRTWSMRRNKRYSKLERITTGNAWPSDRNSRQHRNLRQNRNFRQPRSRSIGNHSKFTAKRLVARLGDCTPMISIHVRTIFKIGGEIVVRPTQMKYSILDSWLLSEKAPCSAGYPTWFKPTLKSSRQRNAGQVEDRMQEIKHGTATDGQSYEFNPTNPGSKTVIHRAACLFVRNHSSIRGGWVTIWGYVNHKKQIK